MTRSTIHVVYWCDGECANPLGAFTELARAESARREAEERFAIPAEAHCGVRVRSLRLDDRAAFLQAVEKTVTREAGFFELLREAEGADRREARDEWEAKEAEEEGDQ